MKLVVQTEQLGLGHAVLTAHQKLTAEPFLLMLGDHLYRSTHAEGLSCVQQLLRAYQGTSIMAVRRTPEEAISHYGTVAGSWEVRRGTPSYERLTISTVVEKPTIDEARLNLTTPGLADVSPSASISMNPSRPSASHARLPDRPLSISMPRMLLPGR